MKEIKYKENDYIVCLEKPNIIPPNSNGNHEGGWGFISNFCFKLRGVDNREGYQLLWKWQSPNYIYSNSVRLATPEEIAEYDRLGKPYDVTGLNIKKDGEGRPLKNFLEERWYTNPKLSDYLLTTSNNKKVKYFKIKEVKQINTGNYWYNNFIFSHIADKNWNIEEKLVSQSNADYDQEMELVESPNTTLQEKSESKQITSKYTYKFKVGDEVIIVKAESGYHSNCIGEIVTILELGEYFSKPGYKTTKTKGISNANDGKYNYMAGEDSFELVKKVNDEIPEYLECIKVWSGVKRSEVGKIYKTSENPIFSIHNWEVIYSSKINNDFFKPSTKEAYEKQQRDLGIWNSKVEENNTNNCIHVHNPQTGLCSCGHKYEYPLTAKECFKEKDANSMTIEEKIEKAKRDYPVGTVYKCPFFKDTHVVEKDINGIYEKLSSGINAGRGKGYFLYDDKWAEIIGKGKEEEWIPKVGDWVYRVWIDKSNDIDIFKIDGFCGKNIKSHKQNYFRNGKILTEGSSITSTFGINSDTRVIDRKAESHEIPSEFLFEKLWNKSLIEEMGNYTHTVNILRFQIENNIQKSKTKHSINIKTEEESKIQIKKRKTIKI